GECGQSSVHSDACREVALGTVTGIGRDAEGGSVARHLWRAIGPDPTDGDKPEGGERPKFLRTWNRLAPICADQRLERKTRARVYLAQKRRAHSCVACRHWCR